MTFFKVHLAALLFALISSSSLAQTTSSNYIVIGAFRVLDNAERFTAAASKNGFTAQYAMQPAHNLYYVYISNTDNTKKAFNFLIKIKAESNYKDAWVFNGKLGTEEIAKTEVKIEPVIEAVKEPEPVKETPPVKDTIKITPPKIDSSSINKPKPIEKKPTGKPFYFKTVSKTDGKELFGNLLLQETADASQYEAIRSGEIVYLESPKNKKGTYTVTAQLPGYKQRNLAFSYANTTFEKGTQNEDIIIFTLDKARKGDYIDFNNVHFFKATSILQPESQNELDGLVNLMKENTKYKIKIHGHCNGTQTRECYTMGTSTNFFAMDPTGNKKETISSKDLSYARGETVRAYLVQQGVDGDRITIKGEGGKVPLYPEGGTLGQYNDRVEVEFVKN